MKYVITIFIITIINIIYFKQNNVAVNYLVRNEQIIVEINSISNSNIIVVENSFDFYKDFLLYSIVQILIVVFGSFFVRYFCLGFLIPIAHFIRKKEIKEFNDMHKEKGFYIDSVDGVRYPYNFLYIKTPTNNSFILEINVISESLKKELFLYKIKEDAISKFLKKPGLLNI